MSSRSKGSTQQNNGRIKWGLLALGMFLVVIAILIDIGYLSTKRSKTAVEEKLSGEISAYAAKVGLGIENIVHEATGAAAIIGSESLTDEESMIRCAKAIVERSSTVYLAVVTDADGKGYSSEGGEVDLSTKDYFVPGVSMRYAYTDDEGILNKPAFVGAVSFETEGATVGYVYLFEDVNGVYRYLPSKSYGTSLAFAIVAANGDIISREGYDSRFNTGTNMFDQLEGSTITGLTLPQLRAKVDKLSKVYFQAGYGSERRTVVMAPTGANDWELAVIINQSYIDSVVNSNIKGITRMIGITIIALCIFVALIFVVFLVNRFRQNEESKDLEDKADTDLLTGLNNKIATERKIQEYMTENPNTQSLMFLFDIDNFKKINDTMGHSFGDEVLRTLGHQLANEFRVTDIIGRLGGDEFVVFLKNIKNDDQLEREGQRLTALFHQFKAGDYVKYSATASIGAVVFPRDAKDFNSAYKAADKALYEAKRRGKNQLVFYSDNLADVKSIRVNDFES